ncbi:MAG: NAD(P)H-hydrate dehydratase [Planctomycetes bacterium]|nr:NAD(P)H-hydrate dehydratase [Planctomycetota bacterium]
MTTPDPVVTREVGSVPQRRDEAHKGEVGRVAIVGGCSGDVTMVGAPALAANAAFRSGAGLVQIVVPEAIATSVAVLAPCATIRSLPTDADALLDALSDFGADVVALGPGLGGSLAPDCVAEILSRFEGPVVLDADGLNLLAKAEAQEIKDPERAGNLNGSVVLTPHPGEARRLLSSRGVDLAIDDTFPSRRAAVCALIEQYGCTVVLKGHGTIVANRERLYANETGNAGMATGGAGDVLTGIIAALIGQRMNPFEAAILGVYLHGLAGDFAAEELGRCSMTATDIIDYLPEAFCEHGTEETAE